MMIKRRTGGAVKNNAPKTLLGSPFSCYRLLMTIRDHMLDGVQKREKEREGAFLSIAASLNDSDPGFWVNDSYPLPSCNK